MVNPRSAETAVPRQEGAAGGFAIAPEDLIAGLGRGLAVIESFDEDHWRLSPAEVSARTGIPRTAARRHLLSLCHFGYAQTDGRQFWLAPRVLRLGQSYLDAARLPRLVRPFIQRLSAATGETVNVSVLDGHEVVYVARSNSPRLVSVGFQVGDRAPAHTVAAGVVLVAAIGDDAARARWIDGHEFSVFTAQGAGGRQAFLDAVALARERDHGLARQLLDIGFTGVAVALKDRRGETQAALGMTLPLQNWPEEEIAARLLPALRDTAQALRPLL